MSSNGSRTKGSSLAAEMTEQDQRFVSNSTRDGEQEDITDALIEEVCNRLANNKSVKTKLPGGGSLNIDRLLPFLCVYRRNPADNDLGTESFVNGEAAYLITTANTTQQHAIASLVQRIAQTTVERLGAFLIVEIWSSTQGHGHQASGENSREMQLPTPAFRIRSRGENRPESTFSTLEYALQRVKVNRSAASVQIALGVDSHPPGMSPLIPANETMTVSCHTVGLEIRPIYRDLETDDLFPDVLRKLRRGVGRALKKAFFNFSLHQTSMRPQHYFALGRETLPRSIWNVDRQLTEVSSQFKFLLQLTPINAERSWTEFRESGYLISPKFEYRPLDNDPLLLKRKLLKIRTEAVEDPTLSHLFRQTQDELDRQITMLADLRTARFLPGSIQVFGGVGPELLSLANEVLRLPNVEDDSKGEQLNARQFAALAAKELEYYRAQLASFPAEAVVSEDIYAGLLCSGGNLFIGRDTSISSARANALLHHEIGTHLVTYYNGAHQRLGLLRVGLAGYDGLQEGLAVLSEYLVGGLNLSRLRVLAARVTSVRDVIVGATLPDVFHRLTQEFGFEPRQAFTIALRVFRGGGLTKDAVYLRGLRDVLRYVQSGGDLLPLMVGKLAIEHIPIIKELQYRNVLKQVPVVPRYLQDDDAAARLEQLRGTHWSVIDLLRGTQLKQGDQE